MNVRIPDLIARIKLVTLSPRLCWDTIARERPTARNTAFILIAPLAILAVVGPVLGHLIFGVDVEFFGLWRAPLFYSFTHQSLEISMMIASLFIDGWILHKLAPHFQRTVSFDRAFSLVVNSSIPSFLSWALGVIPTLLYFKFFAFAYSFYILYIGFDKMMERNANAPQNDTKPAFYTAAFCLILITHVILHALVEPMTPSPFFDIAQ
jgi:hypothetical protein